MEIKTGKYIYIEEESYVNLRKKVMSEMIETNYFLVKTFIETSLNLNL